MQAARERRSSSLPLRGRGTAERWKGFLVQRKVSHVVTSRGCAHVHLAAYQNFLKLNEKLLNLWKELLDRVPHAQLHLRDTMQSPKRVAALTERCTSLAFPMERVTIEMGSNDYLDDLARMDLALDTDPYPGGAMTATALYLGVPVLTLRGDSHSRSVGASILTAAGLPELIAENREAYAEKAVELCSSKRKLDELKVRVRNEVPKSKLCDYDEYQAMWQRALLL